MLKATLTRDRFQTNPNGSGPKSDRIGLLFTRDRSGTGPEQIQTDPKLDLLFSSSNFGSIWVGSGPVPERSRVNRRPIRSDLVRNDLVQGCLLKIRLGEQELERQLANDLFWSRLSNFITNLDCSTAVQASTSSYLYCTSSLRKLLLHSSCRFQMKFLPCLMLLSGDPQLSGHFPIPQGWLLNMGLTQVTQSFVASMESNFLLKY